MNQTRDDQVTTQPFRKYFTLSEANKALPLVRAIASDLAELSRDVIERRQRIDMLSFGRDVTAHDPYTEELAEVERELEQDEDRLRALVQELRDLGVEAKNPTVGLVDFPCLLDGRVVLLCWQLSEPEVLFWHELEAGFAGRQPVGTLQSHGMPTSLN